MEFQDLPEFFLAKCFKSLIKLHLKIKDSMSMEFQDFPEFFLAKCFKSLIKLSTNANIYPNFIKIGNNNIKKIYEMKNNLKGH